MILRYALDFLGEDYVLDVLEDGEEALRFIREHRTGKRPPAPCVIILDLHLPKHDGLEVLREIVRTPPLRHIRVLATTGYARPIERREIDALGAVYWPKPVSVDEYLLFAAEAIAGLRAAAREGHIYT